MAQITTRTATPEDAATIMGFVKELAEYEKMPDAVKITEEVMKNDLQREACCAILAFEDSVPAGMVLYYYAYSTWQGQFIHMEDLYVKPEYRRKGIGRLLWVELAKIAKERCCERLQWNVLDWNKPAIDFYKTTPFIDLSKEGWLIYRLDSAGIDQLASTQQS